MGTYKAVAWLGGAVASVLDQAFGDLQLIVIDDGSTDETLAVVAAVRAPRPRVERQPRSGLMRALIRALAFARAPLLPSPDDDDLVAPDRPARLRAFLLAHPEVGPGATREVDADGRERRIIRPPADHWTLRTMLMRRNPFVHSLMVMRRDLVERAGGYDAALPVAQDYDFWLRLSELTRMANLPDVPATRRFLPDRVTVRREGERLRAESRARWRAVRRGAYPPSCAVFALRPALALAVQPRIQRWLRSRGPE
jgi:glycosyltransferase involved in cell wall biosynthesis